jgi:hypothetical protein
MEMSTRSHTNRIDRLDSGKEVVTAFERPRMRLVAG